MTSDLLTLAVRLRASARAFTENYNEQLKRLIDCATEMDKSWSGSNLGYHAFVYYGDLAERPPGAQFSSDWGLNDMSYIGMGTRGDWREYPRNTVMSRVNSASGNPDLREAEEASAELAVDVERAKDELLSTFTIELEKAPDTFLERLRDEIEKVRVRTFSEMCRAILPSGKMTSRDINAITAGLQIAPHQEIIAKAAALQVPSMAAIELSEIARKAGSHIGRKEKGKRRLEKIGTNVFIGHGRSTLWRELKDFVVDRLQLPYEEFNRVPVAGVTNIARLSEMLDGAGCALVVLTAEDEQADGSLRARMNVIHEVGLFQGRLGFTKAIVILEDGCEEFSNIQGLGQIRFPRGRISAAFEEIRSVLEREGLC